MASVPFTTYRRNQLFIHEARLNFNILFCTDFDKFTKSFKGDKHLLFGNCSSLRENKYLTKSVFSTE